MMYIQLSLPYRNYNKVIIKTINMYDKSMAITYSVIDDNQESLFEKTFHITQDDSKYSIIMSEMPISNFSIIDNLHKIFLTYMVENNIETGTLEVI